MTSVPEGDRAFDRPRKYDLQESAGRVVLLLVTARTEAMKVDRAAKGSTGSRGPEGLTRRRGPWIPGQTRNDDSGALHARLFSSVKLDVVLSNLELL